MSTNLLFWAFNIASLITLIVLLIMTRKESTVQVRFLVLMALVGAGGYYYFSERNAFYVHASAARAKHSLQTDGPIELAAVWDSPDDGFFRGAALAVEEINGNGGVWQKNGGGRARRLLKLSTHVEHPGEENGVQYALAREPQVAAVIGHRNAETALAASLTYENNKLLYLASTVTDPSLTKHGFEYIFRSVPDDRQYAGELVTFCRSHGVTRIAVLFPRTQTSKTFADLFRYTASVGRQSGQEALPPLSIVLMQSYAPDESDFSDVVASLLAEKFDAILIADTAARAGPLIMQLREHRIDQLILGSASMAAPEPWEALRHRAGELVVASAIPLANVAPSGMAATFAARYQARYGTAANHWAGQGYESVRLLAQAWERSGTTLPATVAATLHRSEGWQGLDGVYGFNAAGEVLNRKVYLQQMKQGRFQDISQRLVH